MQTPFGRKSFSLVSIFRQAFFTCGTHKIFTSSNTNQKLCPAIYACQNKLNNKDNKIIREKYGILSRKILLYSTVCQRKMFAYGRHGRHIPSGFIFFHTLPLKPAPGRHLQLHHIHHRGYHTGCVPYRIMYSWRAGSHAPSLL